VKIIDSHTHIGPGPSDYLTADAEAILSQQRRFGIVVSIVSSFEALQWSLVRGNESVVGDAERHPSIYVALVLNPRRPDTSSRLLERFATHPKVVAVKIHPVMHGYDLEMRMVPELIEGVWPYGLPILSHCQTERPLSGIALRHLAERFPDVTFIAAHYGIAGRGPGERVGEMFDDSAPPNLYTDMASRRSAEYGFFRYAVDTIGADRILWGSDGMAVEITAMLGVLQMADITEEERETIAYGNAIRVFGDRLRES